jgi:hypothetical protein
MIDTWSVGSSKEVWKKLGIQDMLLAALRDNLETLLQHCGKGACGSHLPTYTICVIRVCTVSSRNQYDFCRVGRWEVLRKSQNEVSCYSVQMIDHILSLDTLSQNHSQRVAPHSTAPHRTAPHRTAPHRTAPHRTAPHRTAPHRTAPHRTALLSPKYQLNCQDHEWGAV